MKQQNTNGGLPQDDEISPEATVDLIDFVNAADGRYHDYIRMFPDPERGEIRLYRLVGETGSSEFVRTVIDGARFTASNCDEKTVKRIHLHDTDASTLVTFLKGLAKEKSPATVRGRFYGDTGMTMMEDNEVTEESLYLQYTTESDRYGEVRITSLYNCQTHRIVDFE